MSVTPEAVAEARRAVTGLPLPEGLGRAPFEDAYDFQDRLAAATGMEVGGYKLAVNGAKQKAHFGVTEPAGARIFAPEIHQSGASLPWSSFHQLHVEPEIAAVLAPGVERLSGPVDYAETRGLIEVFRPAVELVDQRGLSLASIELAQAIATNVFNAGIVLGSGGVAPADLDTEAVHVTLDIDGTREAEVTGNAPQDPVEAVMWMLNHLHRRGHRAAPGQIVMCGTHVPLHPVAPGARRVEVAMAPLGEVSFSLT